MDLNAELVSLLNKQVISKQVFDLIDLGADPNCINSQGNSLLHMLILNHQFEEALRLIRNYQANINQKNKSGFPPLYYMLNDKYTSEQIMAMITLGAFPFVKNSRGLCPIHLFLYNNNFQFVSQLLELHPECVHYHCQEGSPLEIMLNQRDIRKYSADQYITLVRCGANADTKDCNGDSLLSIILDFNNTEKVKELVALSKIHPAERIHYRPELADFFLTQEGLEDLIEKLHEGSAKPSDITYLARYPLGKEMVIQTIKAMDAVDQKSLLNECLRPGSQLNLFFSIQRGWFNTSIHRGTLAQLKQMLNNLETENNDHQEVATQETNSSCFPTN